MAAPHALICGQVSRVRGFFNPTANALGGIQTCAADMCKWLAALLHRGKLPDGRPPLYSRRVARDLCAVLNPISPNPVPGGLTPLFEGYGLGLRVGEYRGQPVQSHTGGLVGYVSRVVMLPRQKVGVAVLTNAECIGACNALIHHLLDKFLGASQRDWIEEYATSFQASVIASNDFFAPRVCPVRTMPSLPLKEYACLLHCKWYGDVVVSYEPARNMLEIQFMKTSCLFGKLVHWKRDSFIVEWYERDLRADALITFALDSDGNISKVHMKRWSPETDFSYDFHHLTLKKI